MPIVSQMIVIVCLLIYLLSGCESIRKDEVNHEPQVHVQGNWDDSRRAHILSFR